ncbi:DUF3376 domain-containing protein [Amycolatopsis sp. CA-126428]|uniref:DUF3376 domain-containing protein n=1 Tax=Amycolatopsis sp. CA-126428 TaxID=2073158 RepID=UPI000CD21F35
MTMVGGASLAIWMGGVAAETSQLLRESRGDDDPGVYRKLLDLLRASVSIDVLTGTSGGGISAACLGLAEAYRSKPEVLRDTWIAIGSLENLSRGAADPQPRSVLDGDRVLLAGLEQALRRITAEGTPPAAEPDITVLLTGTMVDGEARRFDDALGNLVRDTEHRMLFRFTGPVWTSGVEGPLALAARSTASFPGAFELSRVPIGDAGVDLLHPDMSAYTGLARSHWLTDGGLLLNMPIRPALREIFERPANADVRRLLLYVVPTGIPEAVALGADPLNPPLLSTAIGKVIATVMSQSISAELDELTRHNEAVVRARDSRVSLAALGLHGGPEALIGPRLAAAYLDRRTAEDAAELVRVATQRFGLSAAGSPDRTWGSGLSRQLRAAAATGLGTGIPAGPPPASMTVADLVGYRTGALEDAVATGLQLINAGFRLGPAPGQANALNEARAMLHAARQVAARSVRLAQWIVAHRGPGARTTLEAWVGELAEEWAALGRSAELARAWPMAVAALRVAAPALRALAVVQAGSSSAETVTTLLDWLALDSGDDVVQARLLGLHVARRGLHAEPPPVDQRLDLVQVSADSRTLLDLSRPRAADKLTGLQAGYFGAFYKSSWRASDWMWGRVDGAGWLVQCLLDPVRLEILRDIVGPEVFRNELRTTLRDIWRKPDERDNCSPEEADQLCRQLIGELEFLGLDADLELVEFGTERPVSLPVTAMVLARARQVQIAAAEIPVVTQQALHDVKHSGASGTASAAFRSKAARVPADVATAQQLFQVCRVSAEKLAGEQHTPLLTRTLLSLGAASVNVGTVAFRIPQGWPVKVGNALRTLFKIIGRISANAIRIGSQGPIIAATLALLAGLALGNHGGLLFELAGLPVLAGAVVYLTTALLTMGRTSRRVFTVLFMLAVTALLLAAFLPLLRQPFFGWLGNVVAGWQRGDAPVWWLVVSGVLVLPAVGLPARKIWRRLWRLD